MTSTLKEVGSSLAKLRSLLQDTKKDFEKISALLNILETILDGFWDEEEVQHLIQNDKIWHELLDLVASSRIPSAAAEAELTLSNSTTIREKEWLSKSSDYSRWLAGGVIKLSRRAGQTDFKNLGVLLGRSLKLGYPYEVVKKLTEDLVVLVDPKPPLCLQLIDQLKSFEQRQFLQSLLIYITKDIVPDQPREDVSKKKWQSVATIQLQKKISGTAALLQSLLDGRQRLSAELERQLMEGTHNIQLSRAITAALPLHSLKVILGNVWRKWGDPLFIKHAPILQQETTSQTLLLVAGRLHRLEPAEISSTAHSSVHTRAISERLASTSLQARFLGMTVAMAVSSLVDNKDSKIKFEFEEDKQAEAKWYLDLVYINDNIGSIEDLQNAEARNPPDTPKPQKQLTTRTLTGPELKPKSKIIEVLDEEDDDLPTYAKPDSDPEDEDEDATLVERNKPKAPVYIRDLVTDLQDTENYHKHQLALQTAPGLIRRKAEFGSELKDQCEDLGSILISLGDRFNLENWHELRSKAMVALLVAQPRIMGIYYVKAYFGGDYSVGQRASILNTIGLGALELSGREEVEQGEDLFPSQRLPPNISQHYIEGAKIDNVSRRIEDKLLRPIQTTIRRLGKRTLKNNLAKVAAESIFFPMTGYWQAQNGETDGRSRLAYTSLLPLFLKTLAIVLTASGPSNLHLNQMTQELWHLLLSVRSRALDDAASLEAILFSLLSILDVNRDRSNFDEEFNKELSETQEWVSSVFERLPEESLDIDPNQNEQARCRMLAAGVLYRINEIAENRRKALMASLGGGNLR